jgi:hypothetical protein
MPSMKGRENWKEKLEYAIIILKWILKEEYFTLNFLKL